MFFFFSLAVSVFPLTFVLALCLDLVFLGSFVALEHRGADGKVASSFQCMVLSVTVPAHRGQAGFVFVCLS